MKSWDLWSIPVRHGMALIAFLATCGTGSALLAMCGTGSAAFAQVPDSSHTGTPATTQMDPRVLYQPTLVRLSDGTRLAGRISGVRTDSLLLLVDGEERQVSLAQIDSVGITGVKRDAWRAGVVGAFVGAYLGTALFGTEEWLPFAYQDWSDQSYLIVAAAFAIPGYCLFWPVGNVASNDFDFAFTGDQKHRGEEQKRFLDFATGTFRPPRFHARVFGGAVNTRQRGVNGTSNNYYPWSRWSYPEREGPHINLFRSLELTYSLGEWIELGGSLTVLSEPKYWANKYHFGQWQPYESYTEELTGSLISVVGVTDPLRSVLPGWVRWKVKGGFGVADVTLLSSFTSSEATTPGPPVIRESNVDQTAFGLTVATSLEAFIMSEISLGVGIDYAVCPGVEFPKVPEFGLTSKPIGNTCIGFTLGIHL